MHLKSQKHLVNGETVFGGSDGKVWCEISSWVVNSERFVSEFWVVGFALGRLLLNL